MWCYLDLPFWHRTRCQCRLAEAATAASKLPHLGSNPLLQSSNDSGGPAWYINATQQPLSLAVWTDLKGVKQQGTDFLAGWKWRSVEQHQTTQSKAFWLHIQIILQASQLESMNLLPFPIVFLRWWFCSFSSSSSSWDLQLLPLERHIAQICKISVFTTYNTCPSAYTTQRPE